jgi:hypothetical protein
MVQEERKRSFLPLRREGAKVHEEKKRKLKKNQEGFI